MMTLWLYLHFPSLQLDSLFQDDNETPIAIINSQKSEVVQLNQAAITAGIRLGMGLGSAAALCSHLQVQAYDEKIEKQQIKRIAQWLYLVTSDICLYQSNGLLLRVTGMLSLYQNLANYWSAVNKHLQQFSVHYHYATGYSPYAARLLAEARLNKLLETNTSIKQALKVLPIELMPLTAKVINDLHRIGIQRFEHLLQLPLGELAKRFNSELVTYVGRLTGQFKHLVEFHHPPEQFTHYLELLFEISDMQWLEKPLNKIYQLLTHFLQMRDKKAHELVIELHLRDADIKVITVSSAQGESVAKTWLTLSMLTLTAIEIKAPIIGITVTAKRVVANEYEKKDLFSGKTGELSSKALVSLLQAKLSSACVNGVKLVNEHRPELATQFCQPLNYQLLSEQSLSAQTLEIESKLIKTALFRPSLLLPQPMPLTEPVAIKHGPERLATGWWDNQVMTRDYYIAYSKAGRWLWVFKTPKQQWFLHGLFS
jgi:protein ImuB